MSEEKVIGSIVGVSGHTFDIVYDLFFTTERVIAVIIQHPTDTTQFTPVWQTLFIGNLWSAPRNRWERLKKAEEKRRRLKEMTPDEMVSSHSRNLAIRYGEISSCEVKHRLFQWQLIINLPELAAKGQAIRFNLSKKQALEAQGLLEKIPIPGTEEE